MGSAKSVPRKITIDNPEDATIIKVTENVVERLQDMKTSKTPTATATATATSDQSPLPPKSLSSADNVTTAATVYVTSHQIRNQIDAAIDNNNAYWENRVKALREGYSRINAELKNEYDRALAEVNQSWGKPYTVNEKDYDTRSCKNTQQEVIKCYNSNRDRSLLCYEQAKHFNQCISNQTSVLLKAN